METHNSIDLDETDKKAESPESTHDLTVNEDRIILNLRKWADLMGHGTITCTLQVHDKKLKYASFSIGLKG